MFLKLILRVVITKLGLKKDMNEKPLLRTNLDSMND